MSRNSLIQAKELINKCQKSQNNYLDLGNCGITDLNDLPELFDCIHLETLILSNKWWNHKEDKPSESRNTGKENYLHSLPAKIANLRNLTKLIICGGFYGWEISDIRFLSNLKQLKYLDLTFNKTHDLHYLENLISLQTLYLSSNSITDIRSLANLINLQTLNLSSNQISDIHSLANLANLQTLNLSSNQISDIHSLANLTNLQTLYLDSNQIFDIHILANLTGLQTLDLGFNQISDISSLANLTGLQTLNLEWNKISDIRYLASLTYLQILYLNSNQVSDIHHLTNLVKLQTLGLHSNKISEIPLSIFQMDMKIGFYRYCYERELNLYNNPIQSPPMEILKQGRQSVLDWFAARKTKLNEIKIILIGDPKAGKTSLLRRLKDLSITHKSSLQVHLPLR
jgi:internalin A